MEINRKYLDALIKEMDAVEYINSSHIRDIMVEPIEQELLMGKTYKKQIPEEYPDDVEKLLGKTVRRLHYPADCIYDDNKFRLGATRLHLRSEHAKKNVDSAVMIYMGEAETLDMGAKAHSAKDVATVMLHDTGVVSALYISSESPLIVVNSWYYPGMGGFGGLPYPRSEEEVYVDITRALKKIGEKESLAGMLLGTSKIMRCETFRTIPKTVMLAVDTYNKSK